MTIPLMTMAFFSDIQANLPAPSAVLADIDRRRPDAAYCLGDLVGYGNLGVGKSIGALYRFLKPFVYVHHLDT